MKNFNKITFTVLFSFFFILSCTQQKSKVEDKNPLKFQIVEEIKHDSQSPFYLPVADYPPERKSLPIGIFDSGTGGLMVLNTIYEMDKFNNKSHRQGGDGELDFNKERFIYLADESNMPYGRYDAEGKADFLRELVIKDVRFLLDGNFYSSPTDTKPTANKQPVKAIVIACNTATAYGLETVQEAANYWGVGVRIMGIVDAGAKTSLVNLDNPKGKIIGVLATEGTVASQGYPKAIKRNYKKQFGNDDIAVVQQAGIGLAGAIDDDLNYLDPNATSVRDSKAYQGPDIGHAKYPLDESLWQEYNFDTSNNNLLVATNEHGKREHAQLNSVTNYVRYMVTHFVKNSLQDYPDKKISKVILGCTHYPYVMDEIKAHFLYIKGLNETYDKLIDADIELIDPSESLAAELYTYMAEKDLWGNNSNDGSEFYISVPNPMLKENKINEKGEFPYDYKYGRTENNSKHYVKRVPFSDQWIKPSVKERMKVNIPYTYQIIYSEK